MDAKTLLARYKPAEKTVRILFDGTIGSELEALTEELRRVRREEARNNPGLATKAPAIEQRISELEASADDATVAITLRALPGAKFSELVAAHPPSMEQMERYHEFVKRAPMFAGGAPEFDALALAPALIGASIALVDGEPVTFSETDGQELWDTLHDGARAVLFEAALEVNGETSSRPLSLPDTDTTSNSGIGSTTPPNTESPSPSTTDE